MTDQSSKPGSIDGQPTANGDVSIAHDTKAAAGKKRKLLAGAIGVVVLAAILVFGIPWIEEMLSTVSTDDAYVNGHVTFVAPRVAGQISRVLVDDNNRVRKG